MNINFRAKSVVAKAATAAMVPTPLTRTCIHTHQPNGERRIILKDQVTSWELGQLGTLHTNFSLTGLLDTCLALHAFSMS